MEWNREPRNKPSYIQRILDKGAKARGKGQFLQQMELGKPKIHMQKNETGLLSNTIDKKNWFKKYQRTKHKSCLEALQEWGMFYDLAAKEKKEVFDGGSMADIFEYLLWDR